MNPLPRCLVTVVLCLALVPATASAQGTMTRSPEELARIGQTALAQSRFRDAFDAFAAAAHARPRDVSLYVGAAFAASQLGQLADAQQWLERALQIDPRYADAAMLLAQVQYRRGNVTGAVATLETGVRANPGHTALRTQLDQWREEARLSERMFEARGAHFSVLFDGPSDDRIARAVLDVLEQAYFSVGTALSVFPSQTINVVLYTRQQFSDVTRSPAWAGGAYDGRIKLPVAGALTRTSELRRVAEHEYVHAAVASVAGAAVPTWLHEGLAMTFESGGGAWAESVLARQPERLPLARLARGFTQMNTAQAELAYAQSVYTVKKMADERGMAAVASLLQALGRGATFEEAFERSMFITLDRFEATLYQ